MYVNAAINDLYQKIPRNFELWLFLAYVVK